MPRPYVARLQAAMASLALFPLLAGAQVAADLREPVRSMGAVINAAATSSLYAPRVRSVEGIDVQRDFAYGPDPRHRLDVFGAAPGRRPILVFVHGGAFVAGNKRAPNSPFYDNVGAWAARNGFLGITMTYRLAPNHPWPAGPEDLGRAVSWIRENASKFGGDPDQVWLFGHSAGASHVAAYLTHPQFHPASNGGLAGALLLSGVYRIDAEVVSGAPSYPSYFGTDASQYPEQSAFDGLLKARLPIWIGFSELDPPLYKSQALALRTAAEASKPGISWHEFQEHSHMSEVYSIDSDTDPVGDAALRFIRTRGRAVN